MKIYIDLVLLINFGLDFLLLLTVSLILKRKTSFTKLFLSSFIGSLSVLTLFIKINSLELFFIKVTISILMILISFGFKNIKYFIKNIIFLYINSIVLGGFLYLINNQFSYKQQGLVFYHKGISMNIIVLILLSPLFIYFYIKQLKSLKNNYNEYYKVIIYIKNKKYECTAFLDTGNKLKDPITNKSIILVNKRIFKNASLPPPILVPIKTVNNENFIKCIKTKIMLNNVLINNVLIGLADNSINIDGVDCILNNEILERGTK